MVDEEKSEQEQEAGSGFVVRDKRRFTPDGEIKSEGDAAGSSDPQRSEKQGFVMKESSYDENDEGPAGPDFSAFILSLATQALVQLGEMPAPEGVQIPVNVAIAKQTIDIISMLSEKTKGNLSDTENRLMSEILHNLRMSYVKNKDA